METERLTFRGWQNNDLYPFLEICGRHDVMKYIDGPWEMERVAEFIRQEQEQLQRLGHCRWALELKKSKQLIGFCGFRPLSGQPHQLEIGWRLHPAFWRQGLAFEAASHVIKQAVGQLCPERIFAKIHINNAASLALAKKLGMHNTQRIPVAEFDDFILEYPCAPRLESSRPPGG